MRRVLLVLTTLLISLSLSGFGPGLQASHAITVINRSGKMTSRITDGDTIRLQIKLSQALTQQATIIFRLDDLEDAVGSCVIPAASDVCQTEVFPSLGWHWDAGGVARDSRVVNAYDEAGNLLGPSETIDVLPRPVVMVHGFVSNWETWKPYLNTDGFLASLGLQGFALGDGQVEGVMNTGVITNPAGRTNTIAQNAEIERQYIAGVKKATGAEMVDLVVHSMGGMISRYYIDRVMTERDVAQLIMLGSPMGGSDCSVLPAALGFYLPASLEIRQSYMQGVFNNQIFHRHGVEFYDLGGTAISDAFKSPCTAVPNDTVVSFSSINAIELQSDKINIIHSDLTISRDVFEKFVRPLLQKSAGTFTFSADTAPAAVKPEPLQFTRIYTGHVEAGGSTELTINIDSNVTVASFALFDPTYSVTVSVRGASGNVIPLDAEKNGFIQVSDPASMIYLGYGFPNPKPGLWKVTVLASDKTPLNGADFAVSAYFVGGAVLNAESSTLIPKLGEQIQLSANVSLNGELLEIKQAHAIIRDPNGRVETLEFVPGKNITAQWTPKLPGAHGIDIVVTSISPDGTPIERTAFLSIEAQPNPSKLQITWNLIMILGLVLLVLALIAISLIWFVRKITHRKDKRGSIMR